VELTYPYFHDGEAQTLTESVDIMGRLQLGKTFSGEENAQIVAFLNTDRRSALIPHADITTFDRQDSGAKAI
jgi:cytochrome c peroxidase